jgi:hypothetical protein
LTHQKRKSITIYKLLYALTMSYLAIS